KSRNQAHEQDIQGSNKTNTQREMTLDQGRQEHITQGNPDSQQTNTGKQLRRSPQNSHHHTNGNQHGSDEQRAGQRHLTSHGGGQQGDHRKDEQGHGSQQTGLRGRQGQVCLDQLQQGSDTRDRSSQIASDQQDANQHQQGVGEPGESREGHEM